MDELVQYYVVNKDLIRLYQMDAGKIAAQVAHAATVLSKELNDQQNPNYVTWYNGSQTKIILKASEKQCRALADQGFYPVIDEGRTQIPPNSLTVVGLPPMPKEEAKPFVGRFQLL